MSRVFDRHGAAMAGAVALVLFAAPTSSPAIAGSKSPGLLAQQGVPPLPVDSPWRSAASNARERPSWPVILGTERMGLGMTTQAREILAPAKEADKRKIVWERRPDCLDHALQIVIDEVARLFGDVLVTSTCRTPEHNRRVGGVERSQHIGGHAVDFYLYGDARKAKHYLRTHRSVGGLGYYGGGRFHIDNGPERDW